MPLKTIELTVPLLSLTQKQTQLQAQDSFNNTTDAKF